MPRFIINISTSNEVHKLVEFDVPNDKLEGAKDYNEIVNRAGHWYMNHVDLMNCTGNYLWSVFPKDLLDHMTLKN